MQVVFNKVIRNSLPLLSVEVLEDVAACFNLSLLPCVDSSKLRSY